MSLPMSNAEYVYNHLRSKIIAGDLPPREKIVIREWCRELGVSNGPVIEALRRLEQEGLIVSRPNVGSEVVEWTSKDVVHAYMTRQSIDSLAARLFVDYATDEQREELHQLNKRFRYAALNEGPTAWREADTNYHMFVTTTVMPLPICRMMETIYAISLMYRNTIPGIFYPDPEPDVHEELTELLTGDDADAAERAAYHHTKDLTVLAELGIIEKADIPPSMRAKILPSMER